MAGNGMKAKLGAHERASLVCPLLINPPTPPITQHAQAPPYGPHRKNRHLSSPWSRKQSWRKHQRSCLGCCRRRLNNNLLPNNTTAMAEFQPGEPVPQNELYIPTCYIVVLIVTECARNVCRRFGGCKLGVWRGACIESDAVEENVPQRYYLAPAEQSELLAHRRRMWMHVSRYGGHCKNLCHIDRGIHREAVFPFTQSHNWQSVSRGRGIHVSRMETWAVEVHWVHFISTRIQIYASQLRKCPLLSSFIIAFPATSPSSLLADL